jgi:hypothetical protein
MKKKLLLFWFSLLTLLVRGDILPPQAHISELSFDNPYSWRLELGSQFLDLSNGLDSIQIITSSGSSTIILSSVKTIAGNGWPGFNYITVISDSNLTNPISINSNGDFIKLISYSWGKSPFDYVAFGNYEGSFLHCFDWTESISYLSYNTQDYTISGFCINRVPTIGLSNDTTGSLGTFSGKIYNPSGTPFTNGFFIVPEVYNLYINFDSTGSFNDRVFSRNYNFDTITIDFPTMPTRPWTVKKYTIEPFNFCLEPDSTYHHNIFTKSLISVISGIEELESDFSNVTVFPNPFKNQTNFYFNLGNEKFHYFKDINLLIYSINGEKLADIKIPSTLSKYNWRPKQTIPSGVLIYNLQADNKIIAKGKFIKQ